MAKQNQGKGGRDSKADPGTAGAGKVGAGAAGNAGSASGGGPESSQQAAAAGAGQQGSMSGQPSQGGAMADADAPGYAGGGRSADVGNMARGDLNNRQWDETVEAAGDTVQSGGKKGAKGDAATSGEHARNKQGRSSS